MKYKLAIFDMDGTILDTLEDLTDSVNYALDYHGLPVRKIEDIRMFLGNGIRNLAERAVWDRNEEADGNGACEVNGENGCMVI